MLRGLGGIGPMMTLSMSPTGSYQFYLNIRYGMWHAVRGGGIVPSMTLSRSPTGSYQFYQNVRYGLWYAAWSRRPRRAGPRSRLRLGANARAREDSPHPGGARRGARRGVALTPRADTGDGGEDCRSQ